MKGTAANDSTLLITVGLPNTPLCAGSGGVAPTMARGAPGRFFPPNAAAALEAFQERRLFAANVGAGADAYLQIEIFARAADVSAEITRAPCGRDRRIHRLDRMRIFRADIDVALAGADGDSRDRHALDHHQGIALHDHAIGKGAAVAFVGVADDIFALRVG